MKITIAGGGNIGTQFAVHCAAKGHEVIIYTSTPELYDGHLSIVDDSGTVIKEGLIKYATADPVKAFEKAELIMVTMPATMMKSIADTISKYSASSAIIGIIPGNGGGECAFKKCIERGNTVFGMERVPSVARLIQKGKTVRATGYRNELHVAALPADKVYECAGLIKGIFEKKTISIPNFLNLTMTPSNPILHTTRLRTIFEGWHEGMTYESLPLFYEEWNDDSSELLLACDEEVQNICKKLPEFKLQYVKSLRIHYESSSVQGLTKKLSSIPSLRGLKTPAVEIDGAYIPDLHSRYFTADFSYGLTIIKQIADFAGVKTPNIDETLDWYEKIKIEKDSFRYSDYGIVDRSTWESFYLQ